MVTHRGAREQVPDTTDLAELRAAAAACVGCELYRDATQTVFGDGPADADAVLVGEQPGDQEDRSGEPFVGPAGRLLDRALEDAGIERERVYVTNAVKHFKYDLRGKRRIHKKPSRSEILACRPWLAAEIAAVEPALVVCLGATAAQSVLGSDFRLSQHRGEVLEAQDFPARVTATWHPSAVLRAPDRDAAYAALVVDLRVAAAQLRQAD
ncbi:UdgX family uracil-DNA binding protein [Allokutzneria oryzae]|uniref:Type-4 uracil-DNA glycosylase n=1 Tax=Allokutzneria oryzae TaxID=1378989 RepID=A0ABV5ZS50_9PSEU